MRPPRVRGSPPSSLERWPGRSTPSRGARSGTSKASLDRQHTRFLVWFAEHNLLWTTIGFGASLLLWHRFGPTTPALVVMAALMSCGLFAALGAAAGATAPTLGLCWREPCRTPDFRSLRRTRPRHRLRGRADESARLRGAVRLGEGRTLSRAVPDGGRSRAGGRRARAGSGARRRRCHGSACARPQGATRPRAGVDAGLRRRTSRGSRSSCRRSPARSLFRRSGPSSAGMRMRTPRASANGDDNSRDLPPGTARSSDARQAQKQGERPIAFASRRRAQIATRRQQYVTEPSRDGQ